MPWSIGFSTILSAFCVTGHRLQVKASAYVPTMIILNTSSVSALAGQARQSYRTSFIPTIIYLYFHAEYSVSNGTTERENNKQLF